MARSTYLSENLTSRQIAFLKLLDNYEVEYFTLDDIEMILERQVPELNETVENLAAKGFLDRIRKYSWQYLTDKASWMHRRDH